LECEEWADEDVLFRTKARLGLGVRRVWQAGQIRFQQLIPLIKRRSSGIQARVQWWIYIVRIRVHANGETNLPQVVFATSLSRAQPSMRTGGYNKSGQDADNCQSNEQLNQ
jgi:hypothetical protein